MPLTEAQYLEGRRDIDKFFLVKVPDVLRSQNQACTEADCISFAKTLLDTDDLAPADNQGANSFTLISNSKSQIVQFRLKPLNEQTLALALQVYGHQIPLRTALPFPLLVYTSAIIPGTIHFYQPFPPGPFPLARQLRTVADLATFISRALHFPQPLLPETSWTARAPQTLSTLLSLASLRTRAPELLPRLASLAGSLHLVSALPRVLAHHDLSELNVFVDAEGGVTGVVDFDAAGVEAFGVSAWGVWECWLGGMEGGQYAFFEEEADGGRTVREALEARFWEALWEGVPVGMQLDRKAVRAALAVGVVNRYFGRMLERGDGSPDERSLNYARAILPAVWP